jgi:hypothetical protein
VLDVEAGAVEDGTVMWDLKKSRGHLNQIWMLSEVKKN